MTNDINARKRLLLFGYFLNRGRNRIRHANRLVAASLSEQDFALDGLHVGIG